MSFLVRAPMSTSSMPTMASKRPILQSYTWQASPPGELSIPHPSKLVHSVVFGTCTGPLADIWGRKKMAIAFSVIYTFCCLTKMSPNFWWLLIGRIFGGRLFFSLSLCNPYLTGVATSMLFSTFESWLVPVPSFLLLFSSSTCILQVRVRALRA